MNRTASLAMPLAALILLLSSTPSGSGPPNPTDSDANFNTAGGTNALLAVTTGQNNTAFGYIGGGLITTGSNNTAVGSHTLIFNTSGSFNTAYGRGTLTFNTIGIDNTAIGVDALTFNTGGSLNTASGGGTLYDNIAGVRNTATGVFALQNNLADDNTGSGHRALEQNTTGNDSTAMGSSALRNNTTGSFNTAAGASALFNITSGIKNTALGYEALPGSSTGNRNIAIGYQAGEVLGSGNNNNIYLAHIGAFTESLTIRLGANQTSTFIAGIAATLVNDRPVMVDANGQLGVVLSSARYKRDIVSLSDRSRGVHELRPVTFAYREDGPGAMHYGLIAEEVAAVYPELVTRTATGEVETVRYHALIPLLLDELQRQERHLWDQQQVIDQQQQEVTQLRVLVEEWYGLTTDPAALHDVNGANVDRLSSAELFGPWRIR